MRRYFDHNATTPLGEAARAAMVALLSSEAAFGNASSIHARGRKARDLVEHARRQVAAAFGASPDGVVFCATGSEAIALGAVGLARRMRTDARRRVLVGASEHPAMLGAADALGREGFTVERMTVDEAGRVRPVELDASCALVLVQLANHETGVIQPVAELAARAKSVGTAVLCDAVQAAGKMPVDLRALDVSALAVAAHKIYGPQGAAALLLGSGVDVAPQIVGGHQERGRRAGTESLVDLVGFGAAAEEMAARLAADCARIAALRGTLESGLLAQGARVYGASAERLCNTTLCAFAGASGHLVAIALDLAGCEVSTGAACSSGSVQPSAVLLASGHAESAAREAIRISLGRGTTEADVTALLEALPPIIARVRGA